jgi:hypothetical protein
VSTGLRDVLPDVPGLAEHWGRGVVHCPYRHGWEVRDESVDTLATGPASVHHALLFRQLTDDLAYFTRGIELDEDTRARFAARAIRIVDTPVQDVVKSEDGGIAGVRLADGTFAARRVLAVTPRMQARTEVLDGLKLPMEDLPDNRSRRYVSGTAGITEVPGVWVAGRRLRPQRRHSRTGHSTGCRPARRPPEDRGHRTGGLANAVEAAGSAGTRAQQVVHATQQSLVDGWQQAMWAGAAAMGALFVYVLARGPRIPAAAATTVDASEAAAGVVSA